jgi:gliding motility-associated-like protein
VSVTVIYDTIQVYIAPDTNICRGDTAFLVAYASRGTGAYTYEWADGWTDPVHDVTPHETVGYSVTVTDECGISASDATTVLVNDPAAQFMHHGQEYMVGQPIQFIDQSVGGNYWHWDFGFEGLESDEQYPSVIYPEEGVYTVMLTITDELGCVDSTFQLLFIDPEAFFYLPNAFTPDGDGVNETFGISGTGIREFEMLIFDRWGEMVFRASDPTQRWDGTFGDEPAKTGVYVVWFRLQDRLDAVHEHRSQVTLLR